MLQQLSCSYQHDTVTIQTAQYRTAHTHTHTHTHTEDKTEHKNRDRTQAFQPNTQSHTSKQMTKFTHITWLNMHACNPHTHTHTHTHTFAITTLKLFSPSLPSL